MADALILSACRTPIGRMQGALASLSATELGAMVVRESVRRAGVAPDEVSEVIMGNVLSAGVGQAPARQAALHAGLPPEVSALTINMVCGSGLRAVMLASQAVRAGDASVVVAGGMENMSRAPWLLPREGAVLGDRTLVDSLMHDGLTCSFSHQSMGGIAEDLADEDSIGREQQDRYALESHRRAVGAIQSNAFAKEIVRVATEIKRSKVYVEQDEGPREDSTLERLQKLPAAFRQRGTATAGNSSMISDGAAAVVVASETAAAQCNAKPLARIIAAATSGGEPHELFLAPVAAIRKVAAKSGFELNDFDLFEINEAFAVQSLACISRLEIPPERVNVHGGAIALGHPIGASGARILVSLIHALRLRNEKRGIAALCLGGGNAVALAIEVVS